MERKHRKQWSQLQNYTYRRVWRILRRGGGVGGFETRPYGTIDTVFLGSHAAPHGFAISSVDSDRQPISHSDPLRMQPWLSITRPHAFHA